MNITFVNNAIIIDSKDIEIEKINVDGLVSNTGNTWQAERSVQEKRADTELGKFAEDAVITALKILGLNYYHSYDSFRRGVRTKNWTIKEGNYGRRKVKETRIEVLPQVPQHGEDT